MTETYASTEREVRPRVDHGRLLDPRFGLVRRIVDYPMPSRFPRGLITRGADVANSLDPLEWHADRAAIGAAFHDEVAAERAAIGEAVERYCGNHVPSGLLRASYASLHDQGVAALDPASIVLFSEAQYATPGFPFAPFTADLEVAWVPATDLLADPAASEQGTDPTTVLVPASLVYCNYHWGPTRASEPRTNGLVYAGIAAGPNREFAEAAALEELVERDATAIWWHSGTPVRGIDVTDDPAVVAAMVAAEADPRVRYHFFEIPTAFDTHVVGCLLEDQELQVFGAGFACRADPSQAALKALTEAIGTWFYSTGILDPDGAIWRAIATGGLDPRAYKPFRADRRYLDDFRADHRDIIDLGAQMQYYLDPRSHPGLTRITAPPSVVELTALARHGDETSPPQARRTALLKQLSDRGMRAYSVDVTTPDVDRAGYYATRVIVPDLYTNAPASSPYLGGDRLYAEPAAQGWLPAPITEDDLVRVPIPHV